MKNRVTDSHKHGRGNTGYSDLALGQRISKGTSLPLNYWAFDELQHSLSNFIEFNPHLIEEEDLAFMDYLLQMTFCINSVLYGACEPDWVDKFLFDPACLDFMIERIKYFQEKEKEILGLDKIASEFIILKGYINRIRLKVRHVEIVWWSYRDLRRKHHVEKLATMIERLDSHNENPQAVVDELDFYLNTVRGRFNFVGTILNKCSSYYYWLSRYEHVKNGGQFEEWMSEAPKFSTFIKTNNENNRHN
jgi:hypothetical protein